MASVASLFKAYDVRGVYPSEIDPSIAYLIGRAFVEYMHPSDVVVGRDMRLSSPVLASALIDGIRDQGANVCDIGLVSSDSLYFAVGKYGFPAGVMVTASHNPAEYNGFKFCRSEARPLSMDEGIGEIRDLVLRNAFSRPTARGKLYTKDILPGFAAHVLSMIDPSVVKPLTIAIDAGNGMAGKMTPEIFKHLPVKLIPLYFELDGRFPNHPANPIEPENTRELGEVIRANSADFGIAFDGDADRMFILDGDGTFVGGDMITALAAKSLLRKHPGSAVVYNLICSRAVPETIERQGGIGIRSRVGHSFIKAIMREHDAIFGGEHSGHFYFRDNWYADSGVIAALTVIELLSIEGITIAEALRPIDHYVRSGEINSEVANQQAVLTQLEHVYSDASLDYLDGLTISYPDWWCNVRASNTQPLLRLNVEAADAPMLEEKTGDLLRIIRAGA
jgi:phosphomannomutase